VEYFHLSFLGVFKFQELTPGVNLDNIGFGAFYAISSSIVASIVNKPINQSTGELLVLSYPVGNFKFQIAFQSASGTLYFEKRGKSWDGSFSSWTDL